MRIFNLIVAFLGLAIPSIILIFNLDLNEVTVIFWPSMVGLMALGGRISGTWDVAYIVFLVALNILLYLGLANLIRLVYIKTIKSKA